MYIFLDVLLEKYEFWSNENIVFKMKNILRVSSVFHLTEHFCNENLKNHGKETCKQYKEWNKYAYNYVRKMTISKPHHVCWHCERYCRETSREISVCKVFMYYCEVFNYRIEKPLTNGLQLAEDHIAAIGLLWNKVFNLLYHVIFGIFIAIYFGRYSYYDILSNWQTNLINSFHFTRTRFSLRHPL